MEAAGPDDRTAVAVFGRDVRLDRALVEDADRGPIRTVVATDATDLAAALRSTAAVLPTEGSRRIVVLTDGVETVGSARSVVGDLADAGIAVDTVIFEGGLSSDTQIASVHAPAVARDRRRRAGSGRGPFHPCRARHPHRRRRPAPSRPSTSTWRSGSNPVEVTVPAVDAGALEVDVEVAAGFDAVAENDRGQAMVHVLGPARVAVVEGRIGEGDDMARALEAGGMGTEVLTAVPSADDLLLYDAVVLVNVPAPPDEVAVDLAAFVEDLGRGLVVIGGDQSYGLGGYPDTRPRGDPPGDLRPRRPHPSPARRRGAGHRHFRLDGRPATATGSASTIPIDGGRRQQDRHLPRRCRARHRRARGHRPGRGARLHIGQPVGAAPRLQAGCLGDRPGAGRLTPAGDTEISPALREALAALQDAPEEIKHMVLFTDGWGDDPDLLSVAEEIAGAGITLSVVGTGEGSGEQLRRAAALGGGPVLRRTGPRQSVPEIFAEETLRVARPLVAEGSFLPALGAASPVTARG